MTPYGIPNALEKIRTIGLAHQDISVRSGFPLEDVTRAIDLPDYENIGQAMSGIFSWVSNTSEDDLRKAEDRAHVVMDDHLELLRAFYPPQARIMPQWEDLGDGTARAIPFTLKSDGKIFHNLGNAVLYNGVQASVFEHAVISEPLYDGSEALQRGSVEGMAPIGRAAKYRVTVLDGVLEHPPLHPADALRKSLRKEVLNDEGPSHEL